MTRTRSRSLTVAVAVVALVAALGPAAAPPVDGAGVTATRSAYLVQTRRTQVTIAWKTNVSATTIVNYGPTTALGQTATGPAGVFHSVTLTGLQPDTRYYYRAVSNGTNLTSARPFRTLASISNPSFRFAVVGDFGDGSTEEVEVEDQIDLNHPRLLMTTGDNVYNTGLEANLDAKLFPQYADLLTNVGISASLGNHDIGAPDQGAAVRRSLKIPTGGYYSFDSSSAHFVVLNSNDPCIASTCPQVTWLKNDLAATNQPFVFAFFHHTLSSCGNHGTAVALRAAWHPIFAENGVDIAFMGHDHGYQRSAPVDGVTYITTGGGGAELYDWDTVCPEAVTIADSTTTPDAHHMLIVDLASGKATVRAINKDGALLDTAVVTP